METPQETKQDSRAKAERISLDDEFGQHEFEEMGGHATELIRSGLVQYWRLNGTLAIFTLSHIQNVWHMAAHFSGDDDDCPDEDLKAIVNAFWDEENPEYVIAATPTDWPNIWLHQQVGFQQTGVLPLTSGPAITWGWRKCH